MDRTSSILIVEDSDDDYEACLTALTKDNNLANPIQRCVTGDQALDFLFGRGKYAQTIAQSPCLILLDLNLPGTDGHEVLSEIKSNPDLKAIPVVIMTTSRDEMDIETCYRVGANSYVVKPVNADGFFRAISTLREYWLQISLLPATTPEGK